MDPTTRQEYFLLALIILSVLSLGGLVVGIGWMLGGLFG